MCSIPGLPTPGMEIPVIITRVNLNPICGLVELWVNMDKGWKHIYEQMRGDIQIPKRKFYGSEGKPGDLCLVCISDTWHRARIVSIQSETYNVFLIDQGKPYVTSSETLAWGQSDSFLLPPEIESCILSNVISTENNWPESATNFLKSLSGKKFRGLVQHVLMPDRIILLDIPMVSKHMRKCGFAKKIAVDELKCLVLECLNLPKGETSDICLKTKEQNLNITYQLEKRDQYFCLELSADTFETVSVTEVANPQTIFCKLQIFSKAVKILSDQIHQHYEENSDLEEAQPLTCGDPCAARGLDGRWYRSLLKQNITSDGAVEVLHVDKGKTELVPIGDIKPLHGKFLKMPVVTYPCSVNGVKNNGTGWTTLQTNYMKSLLLNKTVVVRFDHHNVSENMYYVTLVLGDDASSNNCVIEKTGLLQPSENEQDLNIQKEPIRSSFHSLLGEETWVDVQNKVSVNVDGLLEETLQKTSNLTVYGTKDDLRTPVADEADVTVKDGSEHPDSLIQSSGHLSSGLRADMQNAHDATLFTVGSSVKVNISCIESLQKFWCQTTENSHHLQLLMQNLQEHYASAYPQPLVESICVARNPNNGMWYRARIIASHHSPLVNVRFIDYGQTGTVPLQDVRPIDPAYLRLNAQAFQCCLFNLKNPTDPDAIPCTDSALTEFQKFVDLNALSNAEFKCNVKAVTSDEEGLSLALVDIETPSDSACKLLAQRCAQAEAHKQIAPHISSDAYCYSTHNIEVGAKEKVWVTFAERVDHFYCQLERNSELYEKEIENVQQLIGQQQCTDQPLELDNICFARYSDSQWCRGQVVELSPNLKVHFVDYGQTLAVNESDVSPFPTEARMARSLPVQAIPLGLFSVPEEVPQEVNQWFADQATNHSFTISVRAKGEKRKLIVELFEGSLDVNVKVRERILRMAQQKTTGLVQQTDQQLSNRSKDTSGLIGYCLTQMNENTNVSVKMTEQNDAHSSNEVHAKNELKLRSQSLSNVTAPEFEHAKALDEGNKPTLDVILEEKENELAESFIKGGVNNSDMTQLCPHSCPEENVNICMYIRPYITVNQTEEVYASCIAGPHYFWCQYTNSEDLNTVSRLAQQGGQAQQDILFSKTLEPGSPCLALFSSDSQWYRAQVMHRLDETFRVVFIDYGNECDVDIKDVRGLPESLLDKAPQAFLCSLNGFDKSKGTWDDRVYDDFYSLLVDKPLRVTVLNIDEHSEIAVPQYAVQIECENTVVNDEMLKYWKPVANEHIMAEYPQTENSLQGGQTESNVMHVSVSKVNLNTCMYKKPNIAKDKIDKLFASCIVEPNFFWCQYANTEELNKISDLAQEAGKAQQDKRFPETLIPGSPCLALFSNDNQWYRAQVMHRVDSSFHVVFVDYGNESDVDMKDVRSLPESLLEKTPQAFLCSLNGFDESRGSWDDEVYEDFYNLLVNKPLKLTVINMKDHSEIAVPQYAVEVNCNGTIVNVEMQKYWKPIAKGRVLTESPQTKTSCQESKTEFSMTPLRFSQGNMKTSMYKEPNISKMRTEMVYASCIEEPNFFWCQYANTEELNKISRLAQEAGQAQQDKMFPETLVPGSPCLALFSSDSQWYRAQVMHRVDETFRVLFIDYGNECDVDIKDLRSLPESLLEKAPQAFLCSLNGFDESRGSWDDEVYEDFYNLLVDKLLKLTVIDIKAHSEIALPQYAVEIDCDGIVANAKMQKHWKPVPKERALTKSPQTITHIQDGQTESNMRHLSVSKGNVSTGMYKELNIFKVKTEMVYASCIVEPHFFWCQYANTEELNKISRLAQEAGQAQQDKMFPETLIPGSPCLSLFSSDNQWYRAQILHRADNSFHVVFIDYGNESDVDRKDVRSLPESLLEKAPQAFLCSLYGFDESRGSWDDEVYEDFYSLLVDKPLKLTVFNKRDHSSVPTVPQYAVQIECEGVTVNTLMEKYWKGLDADQGLAQSF